MAYAKRGRNHISGTWGHFWWDNMLIAEVKSYEAKVNPKREEVQMDLDMDSKIVALAGEGTFVVKKFFTRGKRKLLEAWKKGEDPRALFVSKIQDPDTIGKQAESVRIDNVWFNELTLMQFEKGSLIEEEYSFGFTPSDASFIDTIEEI